MIAIRHERPLLARMDPDPEPIAPPHSVSFGFLFLFLFSAIFFHSLSLFLSLSVSCYSCYTFFCYLFLARSRVKATEHVEFVAFVSLFFLLFLFFLRILDSPVGHRATKNACLSIRGAEERSTTRNARFVEAKNKTGFVVCTRDYVLGKIFVFVGDRVKHGEYSKTFSATCVIFRRRRDACGAPMDSFGAKFSPSVCRERTRAKKFRVNTPTRRLEISLLTRGARVGERAEEFFTVLFRRYCSAPLNFDARFKRFEKKESRFTFPFPRGGISIILSSLIENTTSDLETRDSTQGHRSESSHTIFFCKSAKRVYNFKSTVRSALETFPVSDRQIQLAHAIKSPLSRKTVRTR